jgi:carbonic anhydrase/acetyltransferase-like protein (isoleucine patch superfamily)
MPIYSLDGLVPNIHPTAWIAPDANIIGNVIVGKNSTIWFGCTLRGDKAAIAIGEETNIQDGVIIHSDSQATYIGNQCSIGHGAVLHGCQIGDGCMIGINTIVLDGVVLGENTIVGAGSLILRSQAGGVLLLGTPAEVKRSLTESEIERNRMVRAQEYVANGKLYRSSLNPYAI